MVKMDIVNYDYFIGNKNIIEITELITDLGVVFDPQYKFSLHYRKS